MLEQWNNRSQIVAHLLNPAFLGVVLRRAVIGYESEKSDGMPFAMTPFVTPLVLHPSTRTILPTIRTPFAAWLQEHRELLIDFPQRTTELVPYTKESLIFALHREALVMDEKGQLRDGPSRMVGKTKYPKLSDEIGDCWRKSEFVGRWLAQAGSLETIYGLVGFAP